ncbi:MAG: single-stranded DNA-binding protein [Candidatus Micrarchaeaceae archaeon]
MNYNRVILMGNITRDPELRYTPSNVGVVTFSLAVNTVVGKDADGNRKTETLFMDVTAFGKQAEAIAQYCKKGTPIFVEGRLRYHTWEDKDGSKHSKHEVLLSAFQFIGNNNKNIADKPDISDSDEDVPY